MLQAQKERARRKQSPGAAKKTGFAMNETSKNLILTESEEEELGSDLEEFLWTYDDDTLYEEYEAAVQKTTEDLLSLIREKQKRLDAEAAEAKSKSK
ncbi:hypothetical protein QL285_039215 [Trifolium repens]|nr:hypothetical protein QL285_039215 [Trifolium repens]